jgi:hypothetical protein
MTQGRHKIFMVTLHFHLWEGVWSMAYDDGFLDATLPQNVDQYLKSQFPDTVINAPKSYSPFGLIAFVASIAIVAAAMGAEWHSMHWG